MNQLSIFAENQKGAMNHMTGLLNDAGINMIALLTNDSAEFGIVRMLVSDPGKAFVVQPLWLSWLISGIKQRG